MDRLTIGETLEGFGFYGTPIYDRPILLKLERHGTVVCEVREMIDHFEFLVWKNPVSKEISQNVEEQYAGWQKEKTRCCARFTLNLSGEGYPCLSVEISEDVSKTFYVKTYCAITGYVCGYYLKPINDYDELVAYLTNIKNNVNFDMGCDLETELTNVINDYLKRLLG